jgi:hypothetical protein
MASKIWRARDEDASAVAAASLGAPLKRIPNGPKRLKRALESMFDRIFCGNHRT